MQTGEFKNGERCGVWTRYRADGTRSDEGRYLGEKKVGEWKTYDATGKRAKLKTHAKA